MNEDLKEFTKKLELLFEKVIILENLHNAFKEIFKSNVAILKTVGGIFLMVWASYASLLAYTYNTQNQNNAEKFNRIFQSLDRIEQHNNTQISVKNTKLLVVK